ncbi:MAG: oligosaccharide flippase family protein, partial [Acidimicrobiales bacterium]
LASTKLASFLLIVVLARLVTPADFGALAAILLYTEVLRLFGDLGMKATIVYEQEQGVTDRVQTAFTMNLLLAGLMTTAGVLMAPLVAGFFGLQEETGLFRVAALSILLTQLGNVQDALLQRGLKFRRRLVPEIARSVVRLAVSVPLAAVGLGAEALVFGLLAGTAAWTTTQWALSSFRPTLSFDPKVAASMLSYGAGASILSIVAILHNRIDVAVIGRVLGERALGLYTVAFRVPEALIESVAWNTSAVAFPALSLKRTQDRTGLLSVTLKLVRYQALYALPVGAGLAVMGTPLMVTLFGRQWEDAGGVASALAVLSAIGATVFPLGDVFKAIGRQGTIASINVAVMPISVGVIIAVAPAGMVAVAWARVALRSVVDAIVMLLVSRALETGPGPLLGAIGPGLIGAAGVVVGAGAVRLAMGGDTAFVLVTGLTAGALVGLVSMRLLVPAAFGDVVALVGSVVRRRPAASRR